MNWGSVKMRERPSSFVWYVILRNFEISFSVTDEQFGPNGKRGRTCSEEVTGSARHTNGMNSTEVWDCELMFAEKSRARDVRKGFKEMVIISGFRWRKQGKLSGCGEHTLSWSQVLWWDKERFVQWGARFLLEEMKSVVMEAMTFREPGWD